MIKFEYTKEDIECMTGRLLSDGEFQSLKEHLEGGFSERVYDMVKEEVYPLVWSD